MFDKDNDGFVDSSELGTMLRAAGRLPTNVEIEDFRKSLPTASAVALADFLSVLSKMPVIDSSVLKASLLDAFQVFDKANSKQISTSELKHVMTNLGEKLTDEEVDEMIREADVDGDGQVWLAAGPPARHCTVPPLSPAGCRGFASIVPGTPHAAPPCLPARFLESVWLGLNAQTCRCASNVPKPVSLDLRRSTMRSLSR